MGVTDWQNEEAMRRNRYRTRRALKRQIRKGSFRDCHKERVHRVLKTGENNQNPKATPTQTTTSNIGLHQEKQVPHNHKVAFILRIQ